MSDFTFDMGSLRPTADSILYGTQYPTEDLSYIRFCRELAQRDEPREYVSQEIEKPASKPQESYAHIIYKALESSADGKMTLSDIYLWIEKMYPYYKTADPVWKNSIRHNLSLNGAFKKIPRPPASKGKGGFWAIDYENQRRGVTNKKKKIIETVPRSFITENASELIF